MLERHAAGPQGNVERGSLEDPARLALARHVRWRRGLSALPPSSAPEPPAYVAAAGSSPYAEHAVAPNAPPTTPQYVPSLAFSPAPRVVARLGVGLGLGGEGLAGEYFAEFDYWPTQTFGFGLEGAMSGSSGIPILGPPDTDSIAALRLRVSLRFRLGPHGFLTGTLSGGIAELAVNHPEEYDPCAEVPSSSSCSNDSLFGPYRDVTNTTTEPSFAWEVAFRTQFRYAEISAFIRATATGPVKMVTLGPTIGFAR